MMQMESENSNHENRGATGSAPSRIEFDNVSKSFGTTRVLDDLTWAIPTGAVVGLLGLNGSGKSTLIRCMLGLLRPDAGKISIGGEDAWSLSDQAKSNIGFVDQNPRFYPWMTGSQLLSHFGSFYPRWNDPLIQSIAGEWKVPLDKSFGSLSPGQQQKIGILAAMGNEPDLLLLDEPVSSLDPLARRDFLRSLLEITQEAHRTVLLSTHITSDLERIASHVAILNEGKIRWFDELDEMKDGMKRIRVRGRSPLPTNLELPGSLCVTQSGNTATAVVSQWSAAKGQELEQQFDADIDIEDLNLEDIFLAMHE